MFTFSRTVVIECRKLFHSRLKDFDIGYICSQKNLKEIEQNIQARKGTGDIKLVQELWNELEGCKTNIDVEERLVSAILDLPNTTHPEVLKYAVDGLPKVVKYIGEKKKFTHKPFDFREIAKRLNLVRFDQLGNFSGSKSYYILGQFANFDRALVQYAIRTLLDNKFELVSVPDILPRSIIENCGFTTRGVRNQVFSLDKRLHKLDMCLSGTSEMSLAALYKNYIFSEEDLPLKLTAVSRCYRAETSNLAEEQGLYRVHEFTKVEMFMIVVPEESEATLENIRKIQENHFAALDIHLQVLDMPPNELGSPAYRKYDIEAWLPGREVYGEISSCSNCTDYQSRRLGIKYRSKNGDLRYVHTLNGTASAIPRLLIALTETGQTEKGAIEIPEILQKYMYGQKSIKKQSQIPRLKLAKSRS
ncbi:hypothetical protein WA026_010290 [Henosepilachna vigintioctopunctata]|uniref:serine--tRNA ligase n=1 Tax=Henosepilachna vigintioctopunctata TaxID=420089 RepID=A0AAW1UKY9_9CUCU